MKHRRHILLSTAIVATALVGTACSSSESVSPSASGPGRVVVRLTDAPFSTDSVARVDMFVVRVDARVSDVDSAGADHGLSGDSISAGGWQTIASPNASFNLLSLQNGNAVTIGQTDLPAGLYNGFRFIIDPTQSSVTLKNGRVLDGASNPGIKFPSANRSGIKIVLSQPLSIVPNTTTMLLIDFDVNNSFVMRGNSIDKNGLLFKPVIKASVTNLALTNATVNLVNASDSTLNLLQNALVLSGSDSLGFGTSSACSSVNAATPALTVTTVGSTTPLPGFLPVLTAGHGFSFLAYPDSAGALRFATLPNAFTPTAGSSGLRAFNATRGATGYDVYVAGAAFGTPTIANVVASDSGSAFVNVPAGSQDIRLTSAGDTTVIVHLTAQTFTAGQNLTFVIAPPVSDTTKVRGFLAPGC